MPFKSVAQEKYMYAKLPDIANKWQKEYGQPKNLPKHAPRKKPEETIKSPWLHMSTQNLEKGL